eukprot:g13461.t1
MFHRILNLVTMMYQEEDELTVCSYIRAPDRKRMEEAARQRAQEVENEESDDEDAGANDDGGEQESAERGSVVEHGRNGNNSRRK